jgi:hypothetical protein
MSRNAKHSIVAFTIACRWQTRHVPAMLPLQGVRSRAARSRQLQQLQKKGSRMRTLYPILPSLCVAAGGDDGGATDEVRLGRSGSRQLPEC